MNAPTSTSLTQAVVPVEAGAHVLKSHFSMGMPMMALSDGVVLVGEQRVTPHGDAGILAAATDPTGIVTGGEDGKIIRTAPDGSFEVLADEKGRWIDAIAANASGAVAWSSGKKVSARDDKGRVKTVDAPTTALGLCFAPKGYRVAYTHYNGVSLWFPNTEAAPDKLEWKGSHIDVTWSADGRFVVSSMQENTLHGWRLSDKKDMRMSGYPAKPRSLSWSHDGEWLATSGADAAIIWPFKEKDGPMGKSPRECGVRPSKITQVAFHPSALVLAIGYDDNCILLCRLTDAAELLVRAPLKGEGTVTSFAWDKGGKKLLFGTSEGAAGLLTLP